MPHALSKTWAAYYKDCEQQTDEELAGRGGKGSHLDRLSENTPNK